MEDHRGKMKLAILVVLSFIALACGDVADGGWNNPVQQPFRPNRKNRNLGGGNNNWGGPQIPGSNGGGAPFGGNPGPIGGIPGPSGGNPGSIGGIPSPTGGNNGPLGGNPGPLGGNPGPLGGNPGPSGGNAVPPGNSGGGPSGSSPAAPSLPGSGPGGPPGAFDPANWLNTYKPQMQQVLTAFLGSSFGDDFDLGSMCNSVQNSDWNGFYQAIQKFSNVFTSPPKLNKDQIVTALSAIFQQAANAIGDVIETAAVGGLQPSPRFTNYIDSIIAETLEFLFPDGDLSYMLSGAFAEDLWLPKDSTEKVSWTDIPGINFLLEFLPQIPTLLAYVDFPAYDATITAASSSSATTGSPTEPKDGSTMSGLSSTKPGRSLTTLGPAPITQESSTTNLLLSSSKPRQPSSTLASRQTTSGPSPTNLRPSPTKSGLSPTQPGSSLTTTRPNPTSLRPSPTNSGLSPTQPGSSLTTSETSPTNLRPSPTKPGFGPTQPGSRPTQTGSSPTQPGSSPTQPGPSPTTPGPSTTNLRSKLTQPEFTPTAPEPSQTKSGFRPKISSPAKPGPSPTKPTPSPTKPGPSPTNFGLNPSKSGFNTNKIWGYKPTQPTKEKPAPGTAKSLLSMTKPIPNKAISEPSEAKPGPDSIEPTPSGENPIPSAILPDSDKAIPEKHWSYKTTSDKVPKSSPTKPKPWEYKPIPGNLWEYNLKPKPESTRKTISDSVGDKPGSTTETDQVTAKPGAGPITSYTPNTNDNDAPSENLATPKPTYTSKIATNTGVPGYQTSWYKLTRPSSGQFGSVQPGYTKFPTKQNGFAINGFKIPVGYEITTIEPGYNHGSEYVIAGGDIASGPIGHDMVPLHAYGNAVTGSPVYGSGVKGLTEYGVPRNIDNRPDYDSQTFDQPEYGSDIQPANVTPSSSATTPASTETDQPGLADADNDKPSYENKENQQPAYEAQRNYQLTYGSIGHEQPLNNKDKPELESQSNDQPTYGSPVGEQPDYGSPAGFQPGYINLAGYQPGYINPADKQLVYESGGAIQPSYGNTGINQLGYGSGGTNQPGYRIDGINPGYSAGSSQPLEVSSNIASVSSAASSVTSGDGENGNFYSGNNQPGYGSRGAYQPGYGNTGSNLPGYFISGVNPSYPAGYGQPGELSSSVASGSNAVDGGNGNFGSGSNLPVYSDAGSNQPEYRNQPGNQIKYETAGINPGYPAGSDQPTEVSSSVASANSVTSGYDGNFGSDNESPPNQPSYSKTEEAFASSTSTSTVQSESANPNVGQRYYYRMRQPQFGTQYFTRQPRWDPSASIANSVSTNGVNPNIRESEIANVEGLPGVGSNNVGFSYGAPLSNLKPGEQRIIGASNSANLAASPSNLGFVENSGLAGDSGFDNTGSGIYSGKQFQPSGSATFSEGNGLLGSETGPGKVSFSIPTPNGQNFKKKPMIIRKYKFLGNKAGFVPIDIKHGHVDLGSLENRPTISPGAFNFNAGTLETGGLNAGKPQFGGGFETNFVGNGDTGKNDAAESNSQNSLGIINGIIESGTKLPPFGINGRVTSDNTKYYKIFKNK